ncbi:sigma-54-dependent Fis family transcriptional regulator [Candidatus Sumerlaeota bacterium]|nr:sigma-54-dependent Fis family transcriptional regulator [Candidatus Sumerlaeota bacterium]
MPARILIVDDEPKLAGIIKRVLGREGYDVEITHDPLHAVDMMKNTLFDVILSDLKMPGMSGIDILRHARTLQKQADFIIMTAYGTVETAVEAMKLGAFDYLIKPFSMEDLKAMISRLLESKGEKEEEPAHPAKLMDEFAFDNIIAESESMRDVLKRAAKVSKSNVSVLLRGDSGTGKEVLAKAIHQTSARNAKPMITVNCGAIPETLLESELFGHAKGAFTGAVESRPGLFKMADGGTIFLDEVGELPLSLQVKLLRVLQEGEFYPVGESKPVKVDVRVIAATNRDLEKAIEDGAFRRDLYYRLNVVPIHIPPLKERLEDIPPLIERFLKKYREEDSHLEIDPEARDILMKYDWPGNVRELENAVEHAAVLCEAGKITVHDLPLALRGAGSSKQERGEAQSLDHLTLEDIERKSILAALKKTGGNQTKAAHLLGVTRRTLGYRMKKYGLEY